MEPNPNQTTPSENIIEPNTPSPSPAPITKSSANRKPFYICLIFAIVSAITAGVFAWLYFSNLNPNTPQPQADSSETSPSSPQNQPQEDTSSPSNEEVPLSDVNTINDLDKKLLILHRVNYPNAQQFDGSIYLSRSLMYEQPLYENGTLSDLVKLIHLIDSIPKSDYHTLSEAEKASIQAEASHYDPNYTTTGIDADIVGARYKDLYGEELVHGTLNNANSYCPQYNYNKEYHLYYNDSIGCGGTSPSTRQYYKYKYTTDNNHAYVYVAAGSIWGAEDGLHTYCDVTTEVVKSGQACKETPDDFFEQGEATFIDSSNYQDFAKYRFVFNKADDGTYYFSKVEKL